MTTKPSSGDNPEQKAGEEATTSSSVPKEINESVKRQADVGAKDAKASKTEAPSDKGETEQSYNADAPTSKPRARTATGTFETGEFSSLTNRDWKLLMRRIRAGKCTPFLGAGASFGHLPLGGEIAKSWAEEFNYPLEDKSDLARVAQFLAIEYDAMFPKDEILDQWFDDVKLPDFTQPNQPHGMLAELPLPIYLTTNYDNFMVEALKAQGKQPRRDICRWNKLLKENPDIFTGYEPDVENPTVFHLHGQTDQPESLVLTEDDYLDFLVNVSNDRDILPLRIQRALSGTSLLFIGYKLADWSFRVLFRGLVTSTESSLRRISVTVQLPPPREGDSQAAKMQQKYLTKYFGSKDIRVYWGTASEFAEELRTRWREFNNGG